MTKPTPTKQEPTSTALIQTFESSRDKVVAALPKHINADRFMRTVVTEIYRNPDLLKCEPSSVLSSVMEAAELGLDLGKKLGHASLIPYGGKCNLQIEYKGKVSLILRSGDIVALWSYVVYKDDEFNIELGSEPKISHKPMFKNREMTHVYACVKYKDGTVKFEVMSKEDVDYVRKTFSKMPNSPAWTKSYEEMAKKTVIHRIAKTLNLNPEIMEALNAGADVADVITIEPESREERLEKWSAAQDAPKLPNEAEGDIAKKTFLDLSERSIVEGVKTSDLFKDHRIAVHEFDTNKLNALNQVLKTRLTEARP